MTNANAAATAAIAKHALNLFSGTDKSLGWILLTVMSPYIIFIILYFGDCPGAERLANGI
jgi:hypothetical protein